ncbi:ribosome biogenesis GTP-binding protein YihA/YsxC [Endothiovibrio diazotrophicus]
MNPIYQRAEFVMSALRADELPDDSAAEVAFAGRSNAGKSSAINAITNRRNLARTSKTPGRTQRINYFELIDGRHLVDLPGYGFAKVPLEMKRHWEKHLSAYLHQREPLRGLVLLTDIRHPLTEFDTRMVEWCREGGLSLHVLLTKADKLKRGPANNVLFKVRAQLEKLCPGATIQLFSATAPTGVDEARDVLDRWLGFGGAEA